MARTKNRGEMQASTLPYNALSWNAGKYIRLSKEDLNRGKDDSNSVANQKRILDEYCDQHRDEFSNGLTYVDDGYSGTDTNRDGFQQLIADVMSKKINCVIVKDLSRLSRNYTDAGSLIENLFVQMNVRFISLTEGVDSYKNPDSVSSILVPITNVMNDQFCYQTSKKIRQVFDYKRRNGEYIGSFAPYDYLKDPKDKHTLIVDEAAAEVVRQIFTMFLGGMAKHAIACHFNDTGVICPSLYKKQIGLNYRPPYGDGSALWATSTIDSMLKNQMYCGDMVQGRYRVKSYKIHTMEKVAKNDWFIVEDTHEPIIDRETFEKAQQLLKRDTRVAPKTQGLNLFSGFLRCADCGKAVVKCKTTYRCTTYSQRSRLACTSHTIKHDRLEMAVLYAIRQQVHLSVMYSEVIAQINAAPQRKSQSSRLDSMLAAKEKELAKIKRYKQALYQDWKDGEITRSDYLHMSEDYEGQINRLQMIVTNLLGERDELENGVDAENPFIAAFCKHENVDKLTRELLIELVDQIKIYEGGNISVKFKFSDELRHIAEYVEINTKAAAI